jgi:histidyl-tRNA synthetase
VEQLGGKAVPAVGFAMGLERLVAVLDEVNPAAGEVAADLYLVLFGESAERAGLVLAEQIRSAFPRLQLVCNCGGGGMKAQFKRADRSGARFALVLGDAELESGTVVLKPLRSDEPQVAVARSELMGILGERLGG